MTYDQLRRQVVWWSAGCACATFIVFLFAPIWMLLAKHTMRWDQARQLMLISLPVLLGYISSAITFSLGLATSGAKGEDNPSDLTILLTRLAFSIYILLFVLVIIAYLVSNYPGLLPPDSGMSTEMLATYLTLALSFLTVVTNALVLRLFGRK